MIRFRLDEHIHPGIALGLQARGGEVSTRAEANLLGADDEEHLEFALKENRVIVTHDNDFLRLCGQIDTHAGIAYCHSDKYALGELLNMLLLLHAC